MKKSHFFFYTMYNIHILIAFNKKEKKRKKQDGEMEYSEDEEKANMYLCLS